MKNVFTIAVLLAVVFLIACNKSDTDTLLGNELEFYLLDEYQTISDSQEIDLKTAIISDGALVPYSDILAYSESGHLFKVSAEILSKLKSNDGFNYHTMAFAVTIDKEIIYTGYFWTPFSSRICDWTTIDPTDKEGNNGLKVNLGYPSDLYGSDLVDHRNDSRILMMLRRDKKLIN